MAQREVNPRVKGGPGKRTGRNWAARGAVVVGLCVAGYFSIASSLANAVVKVNPATAHALAPGSGVIMAEYAERMFTEAPRKDANSLPAKLAKRALRADPTATAALTVLGIQAQLQGDAPGSDRVFSYSKALSRRELRASIWGIEKAATLGDIAGALRNYDIALRTSSDSPYLLFPNLAAALHEPRIRAELLPILASRPMWGKEFLAYAALSGVEPEGTIALFREGRHVGLEVTDEMRANLVNVLTLQNKPEQAWAYYRGFRKNARRDRSRDSGFTLDDDSRTVFDWQVGEDTRLAAAISRGGGGRGVLEFSVPPSIGGEVASQTQLLSPGTYRLSGRSTGLNQSERSQPYWTLTCAGGRELGRVAVPNSDRNEGRFFGRFRVPTGCPVQVLSLIALPSDDIIGVSGKISWARLEPAQ